MMRLIRAFLTLTFATCAIVLSVSIAPAFAGVPAWLVNTSVQPKVLPLGGTGEIVINVNNVGGANTDETPFVISDKLPAGMKVSGTPVCIGELTELTETTVGCTIAKRLVVPYGQALGGALRLIIKVTVEQASPGAKNTATVAGGGALSQSEVEPVSVGSGAAPDGFGTGKFEQVALNENGSPDTQAGSHPFEYTTTIELNKRNKIGEDPTKEHQYEEELVSGGLVKDLHFNLPPGLIGNPSVVPECTTEQFSQIYHNAILEFYGDVTCPDNTVIGVADIFLNGGPRVVPLFNLVPNVGEPARFGFDVLGVAVVLDTSVRSGGDYAVVVSANNISDILAFTGSQVTFWGVPSDPRHDSSRGYRCLAGGFFSAGQLGPCPTTPKGQNPAAPFLTLPTSCNGPLRSTVQTDSWGTTEEVGPFEHPGEYQTTEYVWHNTQGPLGLDGCNHLPFEPTIAVTPDGQNASSPTGLLVTQHIPQDDTLAPTGLAESDVRNTTVTLPAGVQISPAGGDGLLACSTEQAGYGGTNPQGALEFSDDLGSCPAASKVGTVKIISPLLPNPLTGAAYLAAQNANPFKALVALYIIVHDPVSGVLVKVAGQVAPDAVTGQLVATFENTPPLPYEALELHFFGSARAPLTTPPLCGTYTTHTSIQGWSGNPPSEPTSSFQITSGPGGTPCSNPQPFDPGFQSGSTNLQAGAFTPFELTMTRPDADQTLAGVELHMPPGLLGTLSTVKLCPEPQASQGNCSPESLIGETTVSAGLGDSPYTVTGGKIFITTGYKGAAYGLSIVNPAKAGPFDLGVVVVRASINVDPHTAALTIKSDPLPTILDGIPLQIQRINVSINRENFTFNPTNCTKTAIGGTLSSTLGSIAQKATSFQVTNCATLDFKPHFEVSTEGKTSRTNGASLHVKLTYPVGPYDANIARVKVDLPKQLPSRLTTLQKACTGATFESNPANCPTASIVGHAYATTPVLPVSLEGPAYFVSHGGEAFPSLIVVLQGYGTTVELVGSTFINKAGITSSTFKTIPDVPVGTFELTLPEGKDSALAANGNLCGSKLVMPTSFTGQNGATMQQATNILVTGCKPAIRVVRRHAKGKKATLTVSVPSAGTLTASGKGLSRSALTAAQAGEVTIGLTISKKERAFLARRHGRKWSAHIKLLFSPMHGAPISSSVTVLVG